MGLVLVLVIVARPAASRQMGRYRAVSRALHNCSCLAVVSYKRMSLGLYQPEYNVGYKGDVRPRSGVHHGDERGWKEAAIGE